MHRFVVALGRLGSGKTEFALNLGLRAAAEGRRTALVDLDLVNPYFTSALQRERMEGAGIELIAPAPAGESVELPEKAFAAFGADYDMSIFDVGGDPAGARVLGSMAARIDEVRPDFRILYVVNCRRPMSANEDDIVSGLERIERAARIKVDGLVNNTNLGPETERETLLEGDGILRAVSRRTGIPVSYYMASKDVLSISGEAGIPGCLGEPFIIQLTNRPEWIDRTSGVQGERRCSRFTRY